MAIHQTLRDIRLFNKLLNDKELTLSDFPSIMQSKWGYIRDNWPKYIKNSLINNIGASKDGESLQKQIKDFDEFVYNRAFLPKTLNILTESEVIYRFFDILDSIPINWLPLSREDAVLVRKVTGRVSNFNKSDWIKMKKEIHKEMLLVSNVAGEIDEDVNKTYHLKPIQEDHTVSVYDLDKTKFYLDHLRFIDFILSDKGFNDPRLIDPFALAKSNSNNPDFPIESFNAGLMVRMDVDDTLQTLSNRYYGTPDLWLQIAIANGLQPPYIDNYGEEISLLVNGLDNTVYLPKTTGAEDNIEKFYVSQPIYIFSSLYPVPELRIIKKISEVPTSGDIILELEGKSDLEKYTTIDGAKIRVYKKYTTNSNYFILIPTVNTEEELVNRDELPWFLRIKQEDEILQKVDLYIDKEKDITFSPCNDLMLSYGINNAIQALMLKFIVEMGELMRHPEFGFIGGVVGSKNTELETNKQKIIDYITDSISRDERFNSIVSLDFLTFSTYYVINLVVRLSGGLDKLIPVSFKIPIKN